MPQKLYKRYSIDEGNKLIDWAEDNNVNWEIWNADNVWDYLELWLERWPQEQEILL